MRRRRRALPPTGLKPSLLHKQLLTKPFARRFHKWPASPTYATLMDDSGCTASHGEVVPALGSRHRRMRPVASGDKKHFVFGDSVPLVATNMTIAFSSHLSSSHLYGTGEVIRTLVLLPGLWHFVRRGRVGVTREVLGQAS